jgi:hypothetical protein
MHRKPQFDSWNRFKISRDFYEPPAEYLIADDMAMNACPIAAKSRAPHTAHTITRSAVPVTQTAA